MVEESWDSLPHGLDGRWPQKVVMEKDRGFYGLTEKFKHQGTKVSEGCGGQCPILPDENQSC
jgi:hypothetical protein